jgi:hypothetical protein
MGGGNLIAVRGFLYEEEVVQTVSWLEPTTEGNPHASTQNNNLREMSAYALASVLRNPPLSLYALSANDICAGVTLFKNVLDSFLHFSKQSLLQLLIYC